MLSKSYSMCEGVKSMIGGAIIFAAGCFIGAALYAAGIAEKKQ